MPKRIRITKAMKEKAVRLHNDGYSYKEISLETGIPEIHICKILKEDKGNAKNEVK